jgi:two-component system chemotaxis response regulator CheY
MTIKIIIMKKIIIADEIKSMLERKESFLKRASIKVFNVASNEEALNIHRSEKVDLIITDIDSPGMSGEALCSTIRENGELCKVSIIIVCSENESDFERCSKCRANAIVTKPVNPEVLLEEAHRLLNVAERTDFRVPIAVKIRGKYKGEAFLGYSENLSVSGMMFESEQVLKKGDVVLCAFLLDDSTHVTTDAEIVRVIKGRTEHDINQYGARFIGLADDFKSAIEAYIK